VASRTSRDAPPLRRRRIRKLRLLALVGVLFVLAAGSFTLGLVSAVASELPSLDPSRQLDSLKNGFIYANDGKTVLAVLRGRESRTLVESEQIAPTMKHAIVAIEDRRFWEHHGIDLRGIGRALVADIRNQAVVQGGSTITQQFVKNAVGDERTIARKVREAALAWQLERDPRWSKDRILTAYLNTIYFGNGAYGIQQAAQTYFRKGALGLTLAEAALLAGIPADPSGYDPVTRPGRALARRAQVLRAMVEVRSITPGQAAAANRVPLPRPEDVRLPGTRSDRAPFFADYVKQQLVDRFGADKVYGEGYRVTTTIDLSLQRLGRAAIDKWLKTPDGPRAALVAIDPRTGDVLAMVGGNYRESQFNLAVQGQRQPGSTFKPFVLATALEQGISPATVFESKPLTIPLGDKVWPVSNYEDAYLGQATLEVGTVESDNSVYAQLTKLVGPAAVVQTARRLGVRTPLQPYFSIGLGGQAATPLELARAYSAFANGGYRIGTALLGDRPRVVDEMRRHDGTLLGINRAAGEQERVLSPHTAAWVNELLRRAIESGTGEAARLRGWTAAGKTGTTENYGDAWFVGYTPHLVTAVWVGYPTELRPMLTEFDGEPVAGGTFPALIWKSFMEKALPHVGAEREDFESPESLYTSPQLVVHRNGRVLLDNGLCRETVEVVYFADKGPRRTADCKENEVEVPRVIGLTLEEAEERLALQPLTSRVLYTRAAPRQRVDLVVSQRPANGTLSSFDEVTLVLVKPLHGVVPRLEGRPLAAALELLRNRKLRASVSRSAGGQAGRVLTQRPPAGVAAAPGMTVRLVVGRGSDTAIR
jgi:penicillin-binding protein 1A